jgi:hypothetical protein
MNPTEGLWESRKKGNLHPVFRAPATRGEIGPLALVPTAVHPAPVRLEVRRGTPHSRIGVHADLLE